jgi:hypothetical protein
MNTPSVIDYLDFPLSKMTYKQGEIAGGKINKHEYIYMPHRKVFVRKDRYVDMKTAQRQGVPFEKWREGEKVK